MVSRRYRRLLQRRLRRRPLLPFLLAATVAVDVVVPFLDVRGASPPVSNAFFLGSAIGQLFLLAVWFASARSGIVLRLGMSLAGVAMVSFLISPTLGNKGTELLAFGAAFFLLSAISSSVLFAIQAWRQQGSRQKQQKQFSVGWLLLLTTLCSFVAYAGIRIEWDMLLQNQVWSMIVAEVLGATILLSFAIFVKSNFIAILAMLTTFTVVCVALTLRFTLRDATPIFVEVGYYAGYASIIAIWLLALRSRRLPPPPFQLRLLRAHEEAAPENPERPLERHQVAELKEINVVV